MNLEEQIYYNTNKMCKYYFYNYYRFPSSKRYDSFKEKNYAFFKKAVMSFMQKEEDFDPEKFIFSVMFEGYQYPQQLSKKSNWNLYLRNRAFFSKKEKPKKEDPNQELIDILNSIKKGIKYLKNRTIKEVFNDYFEVLKFKADNPPCDLLLFYFSKYYNEWFFNNNPDSDGLFIIGARKTVEKYPLVIEKLREFLKDDFLESDY